MSNLDNVTFSRVKVVRIPLRVAVSLLFAQGQLPQCVSLPSVNLPEGYKVVSCHVNPLCNAVDVVVWHPSFDPVPEGQEPPQFVADVEWRIYALDTEAKASCRSLSDDPTIATGILVEEPR
jgi:hypothetical protein